MRAGFMAAALVALLLLATSPGAFAAFELPEGRSFVGDLRPAGETSFVVSVRATGESELYVKLLPTPGNAVHDGTRANGTLDPPTGWRITFRLERGDGERVELGARVDSTPTDNFRVLDGETVRIVATVHQPEDAAEGSVVHFAIAERAPTTEDGASGARADPALAVTLRLGHAPETRATTGAPEEPARTSAPGLALVALALVAAACLLRLQK